MAKGLLDELIDRVAKKPAPARRRIAEEVHAATRHMTWVPNPGPQTDAYLSKADVLLFGGEPGGGKTQLVLGLAFNEHEYSLLMRRHYSDMEGGTGLTAQAITLNGSRDGFNGSIPPTLKRPDGRVIDFGAAKTIGDEQQWQGKPHDLIGIDEATQFAYVQVRFLMGWLRSVTPGQRKRVVMATNPPLGPEGLWVVEMFAPWLDERFDNPAAPGELRWAVIDQDGKMVWVKGPEDRRPVGFNGKMVEPLSYTFVPSSVADNPYLAGTDYEKQLDNLIEPYRSILMGKFKTLFRDVPNQAIPTSWIREAQKRWTPHPPEGIPMCSIGVDVAQGGDDETALAIRHDGWFATMLVYPGRETPLGTDVAGRIVAKRRNNATVVLDLGGGYGGAAFEHLKGNDIETVGFKGAESTTKRARDGKLKFTNCRTAAYWLFREALDPGQPNGSPIALPDDSKLVADLAAPVFEFTPNGIKLERKEDVAERLGRSPDRGDAVVMAWWAGPRELTHAMEWIDRKQQNYGRGMRGMDPKVQLGHQAARRKR